VIIIRAQIRSTGRDMITSSGMRMTRDQTTRKTTQRAMRIISILPTFKNETAHNYRINIGFINKLSTLCDYIPIQAYNKDSLVYTAKELYEQYKPDAMLLLAHSEVLRGYLKDIPCLKVMIAVDFHKIVKRNNYSWYKDNGFDLVLFRGIYNKTLFDKHIGVASVWLSYSADEKEFYPRNWNVVDRIGFAGTTSTTSYAQRRTAIEKLTEADLIDNGGKIVGNDYPMFLRSHISMLTDTAISDSGINSPHAKAFEIMASGSVLLSPPMDSDIITNYVCYKGDCSDVVEKSQYILENKDRAREMASNAYDEFRDKHTDIIRIRELFELLRLWI